MSHLTTQRWLEVWGYVSAQDSLHRHHGSLPAYHAYRNELEELLKPNGIIRATAVFDVEGIPTICFIEDNGQYSDNPSLLDRIREKIWNQNLISVVLVVHQNNARAFPVLKRELKEEILPLSQARETSPFSRRDVQSGEIFQRHAEWFAAENRVDRDLLRNIDRVVRDLAGYGMDKADAQYLMAQILFVSYLEHRDIVGDTYRATHGLSCLEDLISTENRSGLSRLLSQLKHDFNGDFLEPETSGAGLWETLPTEAIRRLNEFLSRVDLETGQMSLWHYDFRFIPVELISGIYESFLSDRKREVGAYYTSRNLANLVVDQAFTNSKDILSEQIYDGACGSGILLTTAYRRMLAYAEAKKSRPLKFEERCKLLENHIFGSDQSISACRVTAFSLYLSMLEGLQPSDIAELQDNSDVKLPTLTQKNILGGSDQGDFFSDTNSHANSSRFTIILSNPPWVEPGSKQKLSSDLWAKRNNFKLPRRNTAAAFMLRTRDCLSPSGRFCLILPVSIIAAPTSASFLKIWLEHFRLETLINFGDLRKVLFETAKQPCIVAVGRARDDKTLGQITGEEKFEYWIPKADISFAFGRIALHSSDRHVLQTYAVYQDSELLTTLFWGTERDIATITELRLLGRLEELIGKKSVWHTRKGFHTHDSSINDPVSAIPLRSFKYLDAKRFEVDGPVLDHNLLTEFPHNINTVARLPLDLMEAFKNPKIVFTDGINKYRRIRAAFSKGTFSFKSSIGVITGPKDDEPLFRFLAVYLHSALAQYVVLLTAYQANFERERVSLRNIKQLPFIHPNRHPKPKRAWQIVDAIVRKTVVHEQNINDILKQPYEPSDFDPLIFEYFGLDEQQQSRVREVSEFIAPYLQPSSILNLNTPLQRRPNQTQLNSYAKALHNEMNLWSEFRGGTGDIRVQVNVNSDTTCGPLGIVKIEPTEREKRNRPSIVKATVSDRAVEGLLEHLSQKKLLPLEIQQNLHLATDAVIHSGDSVYLIKPLVARLWLHSQAYRDAERIVLSVLSLNLEREANL